MNKKNAEEKVKLSRILRIDAEIRSGRYPNSKELAAIEEVSIRTILRDIDYLKDSYGAPIDYDHSKHGFFYIDPNFFIRSVMLSKEDLETITSYDSLVKLGTLSDETGIYAKLRKIIDKLLITFPEGATKSLPFIPAPKNNPDCDFSPIDLGVTDNLFGMMDDQYDYNIVAPIERAIENKEVIEIEYWISDNRKWTKEKIEPMHIFNQDLHTYVLAYKNKNHNRPGIYSLRRIRKVIKTDEHFDIPTDFKVSDYVKSDNAKKEKKANVSPVDNKLYHFELSIPKEFASEAINKTYYHNQHIKLCKDGTVYVSFKSTELFSVYYWALSEGHRVKVLNPPELVEMVKREAQKVVRYYV